MTDQSGRVLTLGERILALPEQHATKSRDYGRGYAQAVRDVYDLLYAHDGHHTLGEPCGCDEATVAAQVQGRRHEHAWTDFDFPREDGSVTKWCPRCGEKREVSAPARTPS